MEKSNSHGKKKAIKEKEKSTRVILCDTKTGACYEAIGHEKLEKYLQKKKPSAIFIEYAEIVRQTDDVQLKPVDGSMLEELCNPAITRIEHNPYHTGFEEESCTIIPVTVVVN